MRQRLSPLFLILLVLAGLSARQARAAPALTVEDRGVTLEFPRRLTFSAEVRASAAVKEVVLEYGVVKQTCGAVTARAFPKVAPAGGEVSWTWEMLQSGSEPPGATIWYRWRVVDVDGNEQVSPREEVTWLDEEHPWQTTSRGMLVLHWYRGDDAFADELVSSAASSLEALTETTGVSAAEPIHLYIYGAQEEMQEAVLYEPGWTGGLAYPAYNIVIIGISPAQLDWGKLTEAHELTHVLVGHLTFSCLGRMPTWLNEGIAVYGEGGLDEASEEALAQAIEDDALLSVRALSGQFSEHPGKADLSYSQSYSLVNFLIATYGPEQLLALFGQLRDASPIEQALEQVYGLDLDELEDRWRESVGAAPRSGGASPTALPSPTIVPTYQPVAAAPRSGAPRPGPSAPLADVARPAASLAGLDLGSPAVLTSIAAVALMLLAILAVVALRRRRQP